MSEVDLRQVTARIDTLIRLLAVSVAEGKKWGEKISLLSRAGFKPREIAMLLGTTPNSVRVELSRARKRA